MPNSLLHDAAWLGEVSVQGPDAFAPEISVRGQWPRLIKLEEDVETRLKLYIDTEIENFYRERGELLSKWVDWQSLYWGEPETPEKNFPFKRASNIVVRLASIAIEAIHSRAMNTLFSVEPFISIRPRSKDWITKAKPFESFLQAEIENSESLKVFEFFDEALQEYFKLGTVVGKSGYERLTKKSLRQVGDEDQEFYVTVKNGATLDRVPLKNFILRFSEQDPQTAGLVGEKHEFTWSQLKSFAQDGRMDKDVIEEIKNRYREKIASSDSGDGTEVQRKVEELSKTKPQWSEVFDVHELWLSFDVDEDGIDEEIVVDYNKESGKFLSIRYNWYDDLHRPYRINTLIKQEGIWPGIGICKQVEQLQIEATTIRRQRLDNATLANMGMLVIKKGTEYGPGEPLFPGKMWFLDDPFKDITPLKLSEVYASSYANEESVIRDYEKVTGVNEVILGIPQAGTPGTATSDLTRLAEGNKKFDLYLRKIKRWGSLLFTDVVVNYQLFGDQQVHWLIMGEDGQAVEEVLNMPSTLVRRGAIIDLTVTDSITNRQVEQQQWMGLFQVVTNYYNQVLQMAQLFGPEAMAPVAQKALVASDEALRRLLETFGVPDSDRFSLVEENGQNPSQVPGGLGGNPTPSPTPVQAGANGSNGPRPPSRVGAI